MFDLTRLPSVLAALPSFRLRTREDYVVAGQMLATLNDHLNSLTPEQKTLAMRLASEAAAFRVDLDNDKSWGEGSDFGAAD